jgi:hypothetical protein
MVMDPLVDALPAWEVVAPPTGPVSVVDCAAMEVAEAYLMIVSNFPVKQLHKIGELTQN